MSGCRTPAIRPSRYSRWSILCGLGLMACDGAAVTWLLVGVIGLVAGVVSGLFGVGGAIVIIPGLVLVARLPQHTANGTSLAALLLPVGLLGALEYHRRGQVNVPYASIIAAG